MQQSPCHFRFDWNDYMVLPDLEPRIMLMDSNNQVIAHLRDDSETDWAQPGRC